MSQALPPQPEARLRAVALFVRCVRWFAVAFAVISVVVAVVLIVRAPDCIGIGFSVLSGEDCTNRDTYFLVLAASAAASICYTVLLLAAAYVIELLAVIAHGRTRREDDIPSPVE